MEPFYVKFPVDKKLINKNISLDVAPDMNIKYINVIVHDNEIKIMMNVNGRIIKITNKDVKNERYETIITNNYIYYLQGTAMNNGNSDIHVKITRRDNNESNLIENNILSSTIYPNMSSNISSNNISSNISTNNMSTNAGSSNRVTFANNTMSLNNGNNRSISTSVQNVNINGKDVKLTTTNIKGYVVNQPFIIELDQNLTTGYSWIPDSDDDSIKILNEGYYTNCEPRASGCPGTKFYVLAGTKPGTLTFKAKYMRPWEDKNSYVSYYILNATIS